MLNNPGLALFMLNNPGLNQNLAMMSYPTQFSFFWRGQELQFVRQVGINHKRSEWADISGLPDINAGRQNVHKQNTVSILCMQLYAFRQWIDMYGWKFAKKVC